MGSRPSLTAADRRNGPSLKPERRNGDQMNPYGKTRGSGTVYWTVGGLLALLMIALWFLIS